MKRLWSPWRLRYITGDKPGICVFCATAGEDDDENNLILCRGKHCFVIMNRYPYNNGHLMVAPYAHVNTLTSLSSQAQDEMMRLVNLCLEVLAEAMQAEGFNIGMNIGTCAGAGIKDHIHMHVVPRWSGDTNFMPVLAETHVIVEALE
ncbi:MAG: HIT family hydrolase, partial [Chloroflexi bacterium RBG_13_56_8]